MSKWVTRSVLDKLSGIKSDLVKGQRSWQEWDLAHLTQALKQWRDINLSEKEDGVDKDMHRRKSKQDSLFNTSSRRRSCAYCDDVNHSSRECTRVVSVDERKGILAKNKLCFNCTGPKHRASKCKNTTGCQKCSQKHHTSMCTVKESVKVAKEVWQIAMMLGSTTCEVSISNIRVGATDDSFKIEVDVTRVDQGNLLTIANPQYQRL